jgi:hypothetical protein
MASTPKWARSDDEKSTLFAENLDKVFTPNDTETDPEVEQYLANVPAETPEIKKSIYRICKTKYASSSSVKLQALTALPQK